MARFRTIALAVALAVAGTAASNSKVRITPGSAIIDGFSPNIVISGLSPQARVRIHSFAGLERWERGPDGLYRPAREDYHGWADIVADPAGRVAMDRAVVRRGTYAGVDGYGLFWSMRRAGDPALAGTLSPPVSTPLGVTRIIVERAGQLLGSADLTIAEPAGLSVRTIADGALNGVFAAPAGKVRLPTILLLHGSEGGGQASARALATRFAGQGYAAFALNYFAWDFNNLQGVPNIHVNQPIELIDQVRGWLVQQPEVDGRRMALYGQSKGAEYAEVAAVRYPWVKAVVACVGTDSVWEGYGIGDGRARQPAGFVPPAQISSWSWLGEPLPYIKLQPWVEGKWFDNKARYEAGRAADPAGAAAAAIPLEQSAAKFLLLGSLRDEVWASGAMTQRLAVRLRRNGKAAQVATRVFAKAGHQICGSGADLAYANAPPSSDPRTKDPAAEGAATVQAWHATTAFLKRTL
ncbi:MAG: acyl-CoA thioester hydrolase/BAAT C-terminal domain-containing protein [Sphingomonas sp.]